jgi:hypothetical protein
VDYAIHVNSTNGQATVVQAPGVSVYSRSMALEAVPDSDARHASGQNARVARAAAILRAIPSECRAGREHNLKRGARIQHVERLQIHFEFAAAAH